MTNVYIRTKTEQLSFIDGGGSFGWRSNNKFTVLDAKLTGEPIDEYWTVNDVSVGDTIFVLIVEYTGGGCEGCAYGIGEILWVFTSKETALKAMEKFKVVIDEIENHDYDQDENDEYIPPSVVSIELENGIEVEVNNPVCDYNATLDYKLKVMQMELGE